MKVNGCNIDLGYNDPGFTLPNRLDELGDITELDLSCCSLRGPQITSSARLLFR